jgi:hypothetical protein
MSREEFLSDSCELMFAASVFIERLNGGPLCMVVMPLICHPPKTALTRFWYAEGRAGNRYKSPPADE